ncbi:uncharacterized protein LOC134245185 isoform X2 [Saccostrea cucullata]|uniref:uncharacterized protein LOC134245185 isoform X2 n=1 Tax=Saccostrea cuccullata TaxID=36930 RepID=UPI002ED49CF2
MVKDDKTGPALSAELAKVINTNFQVRPSEDKAKNLCEKHNRLENCSNMTVPRINEEIWPSLKKKAQSIDFKIQKSQTIVLKALSPACSLLDKLISARKSKTSEVTDMKECLELAQDTVKLLQLAFTDLSHKRRYLIRPEWKQSYKPLCNDSNKVTEFLFGDNVDEKIKKIDTSKKVSKKLQGYSFQGSSAGKNQGSHQKSYGSGYRFSGKPQTHGTYSHSYKYDQNNNGSFLGKGRGRRPPQTQQKK